MKVEIQYQLRNEDTPQSITLTAEEYFDPIDEKENYEEDGVAKYIHAVDYLPYSQKELRWTELKVVGKDDLYVVRTEFYGNGESMIWHRSEIDGYDELCVETRLTSSKSHIVRIHKSLEGNWSVNYSGIIEDLPDGSQKEVKYITLNTDENN